MVGGKAIILTGAGGDDQGDLQMINLYPHNDLTTLLYVNTELARIIDPNAPDMDDGPFWIPSLFPAQ